VAMRTKPQSLSELSMRRLVYNYGDHHRNVLAPVDETGVDTAAVDEAAVIAAEVRHAVREEMALTLADVLLRRTELGAAGWPGAACVHHCATVMADELGWSPTRMQQEIAAYKAGLPWTAPADDNEQPLEVAYA
ncbi:MAG: hypothetical protein KDE53_27295, partial [Caldilineaceae bacterium]|nr:hypothetical protein [Caldilineaceae bacterium]